MIDIYELDDHYIFQDKFTVGDIKSLDDEECLEINLIYAYLSILCNSVQKIKIDYVSTHIFYDPIENAKKNNFMPLVLNNTQVPEIILFPVNHDFHYSLLAASFKTNKIILFDSLIKQKPNLENEKNLLFIAK